MIVPDDGRTIGNAVVELKLVAASINEFYDGLTDVVYVTVIENRSMGIKVAIEAAAASVSQDIRMTGQPMLHRRWTRLLFPCFPAQEMWTGSP